MKIESLNVSQINQERTPTQSTEKTDLSFEDWIAQGSLAQLSETNQQLQAADQALRQLALGKTKNLHQTMLTLEQAKWSLQWLEQIRNRLMTAYQTLLSEQI